MYMYVVPQKCSEEYNVRCTAYFVIAEFRVTAGTPFYSWIYTLQYFLIPRYFRCKRSANWSEITFPKNNLSLKFFISDNNKFKVYWLRHKQLRILIFLFHITSWSLALDDVITLGCKLGFNDTGVHRFPDNECSLWLRCQL